MTMSSKEKCSEDMEWSADDSIQLFFALEGLKPVGINKHFYMACIAERLSKSLNRDVPTDAIWAYLRKLYNLELLDEMEPLPFPNEQIDFFLPDAEFSDLMSLKKAKSEEKRQISENPVSTTSTTSLTTANNTNTSKTLEKTSIIKSIITLPSKESKEIERKTSSKIVEAPKRTPKRTRGSMSLESNSPSTTPPPIQSNKRRRI